MTAEACQEFPRKGRMKGLSGSQSLKWRARKLGPQKVAIAGFRDISTVERLDGETVGTEVGLIVRGGSLVGQTKAHTGR